MGSCTCLKGVQLGFELKISFDLLPFDAEREKVSTNEVGWEASTSNGIRMSSCCLEIKLSNDVCPTMVNRNGVVMKPGNYQRSKKKRTKKKDAKIYAGSAQPFVFALMHESRK